MLSYRRRPTKTQFGPRSAGARRRKTEAEAIEQKLDRAWRSFLGIRSDYFKGKATKAELETALRVLRRVQKKAGVRMHVPDQELLPWAEP